MARSVNTVQVLGNVTAKPELKHTDGGTAVTNFSVATNESYKDSSGEWQERPQFHNFTAWGKQAEIITQYVEKGTQIFIQGSLNYGSYQKTIGGEEVTFRTVEIRVDDFTLCGRAGGSGNPAPAVAEAAPVAEGDELPF